MLSLFTLWYAADLFLWYTDTMPYLRRILNMTGATFVATSLASATMCALWSAKAWLRYDTCMRPVRHDKGSTESGKNEECSWLVTHIFFGGLFGFLAPWMLCRIGSAVLQASIAIKLFPSGSYANSVRLYYPHSHRDMIHGWNGQKWMTLSVPVNSRWGFKDCNENCAHPDIIKQLEQPDKID